LIQENLLFLSFLDLPSNKEKTRVFAESIFILDMLLHKSLIGTHLLFSLLLM